MVIKTAKGEKEKAFQRLTANFSGVTRYDEMEGRKYLVAPMVMLTEGVHAGSNGPLFYPGDEIAKLPQTWNSKPVTVYHPSGGSACTPEEMTARKVGVIMNTRFENGKLKAEAWLEPTRLEAIDDRILEAIESETVMELSTGLFTENERVEDGEWNGEKYKFIARNYRPDHLAILPDIKGACSIEDGAGFLRLNELSHGSIRSLLASSLNDSGNGVMIDGAWIEEVFDDYFIYSCGEGKLVHQSYMIKDDEVVIVGEAEEVDRVVEYRKKDGKVIGNQMNRKVVTMKKSEIIDALITSNATHWAKEDRSILVTMDKKVLEKMLPVTNKDEEQEAEVIDNDVEEIEVLEINEEVEDEDVPVVENKDKEISVNQFLKTVPAKFRSVLNEGLRAHNEEKTKLINIIISNGRNMFTEEGLRRKDVSELRALSALASDKTEDENEEFSTLNYSGLADPVTNVSEKDALIAPSMSDIFPIV